MENNNKTPKEASLKTKNENPYSFLKTDALAKLWLATTGFIIATMYLITLPSNYSTDTEKTADLGLAIATLLFSLALISKGLENNDDSNKKRDMALKFLGTLGFISGLGMLTAGNL